MHYELVEKQVKLVTDGNLCVRPTIPQVITWNPVIVVIVMIMKLQYWKVFPCCHQGVYVPTWYWKQWRKHWRTEVGIPTQCCQGFCGGNYAYILTLHSCKIAVYPSVLVLQTGHQKVFSKWQEPAFNLFLTSQEKVSLSSLNEISSFNYSYRYNSNTPLVLCNWCERFLFIYFLVLNWCRHQSV